MADSPAVQRFVTRNGMSAGFARRFVAGETMEDAARAVRALNAQGLTASLDLLGENVATTEQVQDSLRRYQELLDFIQREKLDSNISLKLTQLGLDLGDELALANMR